MLEGLPCRELFAEYEEPETVHTVTDYLVTSAQSEGQAVALPALVGLDDDPDGRVVGVGVDGVTAVTLQGGGEPEVRHRQINNPRLHPRSAPGRITVIGLSLVINLL